MSWALFSSLFCSDSLPFLALIVFFFCIFAFLHFYACILHCWYFLLALFGSDMDFFSSYLLRYLTFFVHS
jgi:hypothetical protein